MKLKLFFMSAVFSMVFAIAVGQGSGPYTMQVGTGPTDPGYLLIDSINSHGFVNGDNATFFNGTDTADTTIWNICFMMYDVDNAASYYVDDDAGFASAEHQSNRITDGTINTGGLPTNFTNTGITFANSSFLTADLSVTMDSPIAGNTARVTWAWTFNNSDSTTHDLRLIWFIDVDTYIGVAASYTDDYAGIATSSNHNGATIAIGNSNGASGVDLDTGLLMDSDTAPNRWFGISDTGGSSNYWSDSGNFDLIGPETVKLIDDSLTWTVQNDADNNGVSDNDQDAGGAMQWNLSIPGSGSASVECYATWGGDTDVSGFPSGVNRWMRY